MKNKLYIWWIALRPKTLSITIAPIICAVALVYHFQSVINWLNLLVILFSAICIQIGTNLINDALDYERGVDSPSRIGPQRVTTSGLLSSSQLKNAAYVYFLLAFLSGIYLVYIGGWPIVIIGLASIISGYAYTGGFKPISYTPLGELFVILFFGLIAVTGSVYLLSPDISADKLYISLWLGLALGCFAAAVLLVNNYRDLEGDSKADKLTLVYYFGRSLSRAVYILFMIIPYLIISYLWIIQQLSFTALALPLASIILSIKLIHSLYINPIDQQLNNILAYTAQLQLFFSILFAVGILL